jgi:REP element-mobilizing transposase RayT
MPVRKAISQTDGVYFITITCARWLALFKMTDGYDIVYNWFNYLKQNRHYVIGYVIMPNHLHAVIAFSNSAQSINTIIGNGKRFMAYEIVKRLREKNSSIIAEMQQMVNATDKKRNKQHEVFEPSFDWKECRTDKFIEQKLDYMHWNPCKAEPRLAVLPEDYMHSSAKYYLTGVHGTFSVTSFMELRDIDLTKVP